MTTLKTEVIAQIGTFDIKHNERIVAELVRYNDGQPVLSFMTQYTKQAQPDVWIHTGRRPAYGVATFRWVRSMLNQAELYLNAREASA